MKHLHQTSPACSRCGGDTRDAVVTAAFWSDRGLVAIEHIPAQVCEVCGEQSFDEQTAHKIEQLLASPWANAQRELLVPVVSFGDTNASTVERPESQGSLRCERCESPTDEDVVSSVLWTGTGLIAVEDIPARVCRECKESYYDARTAHKLMQLTAEGCPSDRGRRRLTVPVFLLTS